MTIQRERGYLIDRDLDGTLSIGIESGKIESCIKEVIRRDAKGVFGSSYCNFKEDNLDFLRHLPTLQKIWFWDVSLKNIDGIYALTNLKYFGIVPKRPGVDFSQLETLEKVVWEYHSKDVGLGSLIGLSLLHIWHFKPKNQSFEGMDIPTSLEELKIYWANPSSLLGLPPLPKLKRLEIHNCRNLETLAELPHIAPNLEFLLVDACKRVNDGSEIVKHLPKLRHAYVQRVTLVTYDADAV